MPSSMMKEVPAVLFWDFRTSVSKQIEHFTSLRSFLRFTINRLPYSFRFVHTFTHTVSARVHILLDVQETALHWGTDRQTGNMEPPLMVCHHTIIAWSAGSRSKRVLFEPSTFLRATTARYARLVSLGASLPKPKPNNKVMTKMNLIPKIRRCSSVAFLRSSVFFL